MKETSKRIKAYKEALPGLRERVAGVALLLVMSLVMMTSATFAWLTLSRAPEVSAAATTVTANGNLEIALSNPEGTAPEESEVGDSAATTGQSVVNANLTWGNLVNLSDPSYGLDSLTLRPAMLGNSTDLFNRPLVTVNYGQDGRAEASYNYELAFTNWDAAEQRFAYTGADSYGVRAISTVTYEIPDSVYNKYSALYQEYDKAMQQCASIYQNELLTDANVDILADLIADYMVAEATAGSGTIDFTISADYMKVLYTMMTDLMRAYEYAGEALADVINVEYFNRYTVIEYADHLITEAGLWTYNEDGSRKGENAALFTDGVAKPTSYSQYIKDVLDLESCIQGMLVYYDAGTDKWSKAQWADLSTLIDKLMKIDTCEVVLKDGTVINVRATSTLMGASSTMEKDGVDAYIKSGLIVNFEALTGSYMCKSTTIKASVSIISITAKANRIMTQSHPTRTGKHTLMDDMNKVYNVANLGGENARVLAEDTYGMAIDVWVRTNALDSCLVLEGNVLTTSQEEPATLTLDDGTTVALYSAVVTYDKEDEEGNSFTETEEVEVYYLDPNKTPEDSSDDVAYFAETHSTVYIEIQHDETTSEIKPNGDFNIEISPQQKINVITDVIGYEGENRVWGQNETLSVNSTTQGNGSCYVFYADNPADQQNSLELLSNLQVAFLDGDGVLLAKARLNKDRAYAESGKVTVPLELFTDTTTNNTVRTEDGRLAIATLEQNEAQRLTMIIYLEGAALSNDQVLAAGEIDGQLNVQFGSSTTLIAMGDDALEQEEVYVTAALDGQTEFNYGDDATVNIVLNLEGMEPNLVAGFFIRQVNSNQGSREETMIFNPEGNGVWRASYTFDSPGTYVFRTISLDGQEYDLNQTEYPTVVVNGFAVDSITCAAVGDTNSAYVLTGNNSYTTPLTLKFSSSEADQTLGSVQLQFVNDETGSAVTTKMTYNATDLVWKGNARFLSSGKYTLTYIILDGRYTELEAFRYKLQLVLGVKAEITDDQTNRQYIYQGNSFPVNLTVKLYDGNGAQLMNIGDVDLYYGKAGSSVSDLYAGLTWNGQSYTGAFQLESAGIYSFNNVTITVDDTASVITNTVNTTPVYTVMPPDPPEYEGNITAGYQLVGKTAVGFQVLMDNADSMGNGDISAVIRNVNDANDEGVFVEGTRAADVVQNGVSYSSFVFAVPSDANSGQDGMWQLTQLQCSNVYNVATGEFFTKEEPMLIELETQNIITEVQTPVLKVNGTSQQLTGSFGEEKTADNAISITVTDRLGKPLNAASADVTRVTASYLWEADSDKGTKTKSVSGKTYTYGAGYTDRSVSLTLDPISINLTEGATNGDFTQNGTIKLPVAGYYYCSGIDVTIAGVVYHYDAAKNTINNAVNFENSAYVSTMPVNAYQTAAPSVAITSPAGNENSATVTMTKGSTGGCNSQTTYTSDTVTITLRNRGQATSAYLTFKESTGNTVRLYTSSSSSTPTDRFEWGTGDTSTRNVGFGQGGTEQIVAGTLNATHLAVTYSYNGVTMECTFVLDTPITIINNA